MVKIAQKYLEEKYNNNKNDTTEIILKNVELEGELKIEDYSNLKEIFLISTKGVTKLTITNCPKVEVIHAANNQITQIDGLEKLFELKSLVVGGNKIEEIDISENKQLEMLNFRNNPFVNFKSASSLKDNSHLVH